MKPFVPLISLLALLPAAALAAPGPADYALKRLGPPGTVARPAPGFCLLQSASLRIGGAPAERQSSSLAPVCQHPQAVFDNHLADAAPKPLQLITGDRAPGR